MNGALEMHRQIQLMLKMNLLVETILNDRKGEVSLGEDAERFKDSVDALLMLQAKVASRLAEDAQQTVLSVTEKCHFLQHSAMMAKYMSPRLVWAFSGEDQQRRVQTLSKASVKGLGPAEDGDQISCGSALSVSGSWRLEVLPCHLRELLPCNSQGQRPRQRGLAEKTKTAVSCFVGRDCEEKHNT